MRKVKISLLIVLIVLIGGIMVTTHLSFTDNYNQVHTSYDDEKVYQVNKNAVTLQYINVADKNNQICNIKDTDGPSEMLYSCFKDYEFATNSEEVLQTMEETKNKLMREFLNENKGK